MHIFKGTLKDLILVSRDHLVYQHMYKLAMQLKAFPFLR